MYSQLLLTQFLTPVIQIMYPYKRMVLHNDILGQYVTKGCVLYFINLSFFPLSSIGNYSFQLVDHYFFLSLTSLQYKSCCRCEKRQDREEDRTVSGGDNTC